MRRSVVLLVVGLGILVAAGVGLWLWERTRRPPPAKRPPERLLIGFEPGRVERVRLEVGGLRVDRQRRGGEWVALPGQPEGVEALRLDVILARLATLQVELVTPSGGRERRAPPANLGEAAASVSVWRGSVRPLRLRFYRQGRRIVVRSSDRPGTYVVEPGILALLTREAQRASQAPALTFALEKVTALRLKRKAGAVSLAQRSGRWFLSDGGAHAAADPALVGQLLRMLQDLRVRKPLGQGAGARAAHGLGSPAFEVTLEAGGPQSIAIGGPCPTDPAGHVAALAPGTGPEMVACVGPVIERTLQADFASSRIFSASPDELKAASVQRGGATLALVNRPGSGGWRQISPTEAAVDQTAAARLVTELAELTGKPVPEEGAGAPAGARRIGQVVLTPLVGAPEQLDLYGAGRSEVPEWARRAGGGRWLRLPESAARVVSADPVALRALRVCQSDAEAVLAVARILPSGHTELNLREGGVWQLVLLQGRASLEEAARVAKSLERYRPAAKPGERPSEIEWKKPVLFVEEGDAELRTALIHQLSDVRASAFVASRAARGHGFDRQALRLTTLYQHNCREEDGKRKCDLARCDLELTAPRAGAARGDAACHGRVPGDGAVFTAPRALCEIAASPVASRRVTDAPLHTLSEIALQAGRERLAFSRKEEGAWRRADGKPLPEGGVSHALLALAPLQAGAIAGYGRARGGAPVLTATLTQPQIAPVVVRFYEDPGGGGYEATRGDRPVRYHVAEASVKRLLALLGRR